MIAERGRTAFSRAAAMARRILRQLPAIVLASCAALSFFAAFPTCALLVMNELRVESFADPKSFDDLIPHGLGSARSRAIYRIAARRPKGSVGMPYWTYARLARMDRVKQSENGGLGLETIVRLHGQPVRFAGPPPKGIKFLVLFADEAAAFPDPPIETFEDMALIELREIP